MIQCRTFVHGDVICLVALDFILWVIFTATTRVALVFGVTGVDLDNGTADLTGFRIPLDVISNPKFCAHGIFIQVCRLQKRLLLQLLLSGVRTYGKRARVMFVQHVG